MRVLLIGGGGREHALAWAIAGSPLCDALFIAPGNPGTALCGTNVALDVADQGTVIAFCREERIDLVVVGPEAPLVAGVADHLRQAGIAVFGPSTAAARIEGSKAFAKSVLRSAGVPTAVDLDEPRAPCVVKADGLAAGKGVWV